MGFSHIQVILFIWGFGQYLHLLTFVALYVRWVKADGEFVYVKLYAESMQGVRSHVTILTRY